MPDEALGTLSVNRPLTSVTTPVVVPFSATLTPGNVSPFSLVTLPEFFHPGYLVLYYYLQKRPKVLDK